MRRDGASVFTVLIDKLPEDEVTSLDAALPALHHLLDLAAQGNGGSNRTNADKEVMP
jgi:hypothetical protein